jgi:hypothetical protein
MSGNPLTRDNLLLSRLTNGALNVPEGSAINCTTDLPDDVATYIRDSLAPNTRRAYLSDLGEFERWGGSIPASAETVAAPLSSASYCIEHKRPIAAYKPRYAPKRTKAPPKDNESLTEGYH